MTTLEKYENLIKEKRKNTSFRDYLKEIVSRYNLNLYKRDGIITPYNPDFKGKLVSLQEFEKLRSDYDKLGVDYDFNLNFWENYRILFDKISYSAFALWGVNENSNYGYNVFYVKNCYISFEICFSENVAYSVNVKDNCKEIYNSVMIGDGSENIYQSSGIFKSYKIFYSNFIFDSNNIWFSSNLAGCSECLFCSDLQNQSYCIKNKQYSEEEYKKLKEELFLAKNKFLDFYRNLKVEKGMLISENCSGKFIVKSNNIENGSFIYNINNGRNIVFAGTAEGNVNFFDSASCGSPRGNDYYGVIGAGTGDNYFCSYDVVGGTNIYYSNYLEDCSFCIGCIGLKNKSYCILNKQYTKQQWYELADKIFSQMEKDGILGNFFPGNFNPFYFNDTAAYLLDDTFTKEEVAKDGYLWRNEKIKVDIPENTEIVNTNDLDVLNYNESILKKVIVDSSGNHFRIVKMEYDFLKKHNLPLPEIHWLDRIKLGFGF